MYVTYVRTVNTVTAHGFLGKSFFLKYPKEEYYAIFFSSYLNFNNMFEGYQQLYSMP